MKAVKNCQYHRQLSMGFTESMYVLKPGLYEENQSTLVLYKKGVNGMSDTKNKCKRCGDCCRFIELPAPRNIYRIFKEYNEDFMRWIGLHGIRVKMDERLKIPVYNVPLQCEQLTPKQNYYGQTAYSCKIYDDRPLTCQLAPCIKIPSGGNNEQ